MSKFEIIGGNKLSGEIVPQGAKNEALQVICAVLLTKEEVIIDNAYVQNYRRNAIRMRRPSASGSHA